LEPSIAVGIPQAVSTFWIPRLTDPRASGSVFPFSIVRILARSSKFSSSRLFNLKKCPALTTGGVLRHSWKDSFAAAKALFNSALEERGNLEIASPVAGLVTSRILSEDEAIHLFRNFI
jgi:hypothetical protein